MNYREIEFEIPAGYIGESMFFNPRRQDATYNLRAGDKLLIDHRTVLKWIDVDELDVGIEFKDLLQEHRNIVMLAIPMKFEFGDDGIHSCEAYFDWGALGLGFGQMSFHIDKENGKVLFDTECMGRETTRKMLHDFVDFIIDNGKSDDWERNDEQR